MTPEGLPESDMQDTMQADFSVGILAWPDCHPKKEDA